ncbi:MAG: SCO family protein [Gammaproteobacteria bacterium]|nr:SCO family protein [Gammaproteobacteria bacterium]
MKKTSRRAFLTSAVMVAPAAAIAATAPAAKTDNPAYKSCPRAKGGPTASRFPQVVVEDQFKRKAWFYEEMVNDKLVLVSFTSVKSEQYYPVLDNLVKVQDMLKDRLGKDVFMYTVTTRPEKDSPEDLKKLAEKHGANWQFITGKPEDIHEILSAFNARGTLNALSWIGNEKTGRWLNKPSRLHPLYIAEAIARLSTGKDHKPFLIDMHSV